MEDEDRDSTRGTRRTTAFLSVSRLAARFLRPTPFTETVSNRLAARVAFTAPTLKDATLLAAELLEGVSFEPDLIAACVRASGGSLRTLLSQFAEVEAVAREAGRPQRELINFERSRVSRRLRRCAPAGAVSTKRAVARVA